MRPPITAPMKKAATAVPDRATESPGAPATGGGPDLEGAKESPPRKAGRAPGQHEEQERTRRDSNEQALLPPRRDDRRHEEEDDDGPDRRREVGRHPLDPYLRQHRGRT